METNNLNQDREKIAERLKDARTLAGLSQAQAAEKLSLQRPAISDIESGKRKVSAEELKLFANLYRVSISWLLLQEDEEDMLKSEQYRFAARELGKLSEDEVKKVLDILKILPK